MARERTPRAWAEAVERVVLDHDLRLSLRGKCRQDDRETLDDRSRIRLDDRRPAFGRPCHRPMMPPHLIVIGPLPPPVHGVTVSTSLVLGNRLLGERFSLEHLDTSDHRTGVNIGRWDWRNITLGTSAVARLNRRLAKRRGVVCLPALVKLGRLSSGFLLHSIWRLPADGRGDGTSQRQRVSGVLCEAIEALSSMDPANARKRHLDGRDGGFTPGTL